jgi:beta-glucuronidase
MGHILAERFPRRTAIALGGVWDFTLADEPPCEPNAIMFDDLQSVPGCFDSTPRYAGARGVGVYRRIVDVPRTGWYRLHLAGLHHTARVFVGGRLLGEHCGGFTAFCIDAELSAGPVEVVLAVDNRIDYAHCPLHLGYFDWYHFGGITEEPLLLSLPASHIDGVRVDTLDHSAGRIRVSARRTGGDAVSLVVRLAGETLLTEEVAASETTVVREIVSPAAELWTPDRPVLHELGVLLGNDVWRDQIGIRTVCVRDAKIFVNDDPVVLFGVNRHEAHPQFGHAVPTHQMVSDIDLMRQLGFNFVRGSHYPQSERFLQLCDRAGILVWSESTGWQHTPEHLNDEHFLTAQETSIAEMIDAGANHPSVVIWGLLNESESHLSAARPGYERLIRKIRDLDPHRPVTYASNHVRNDVCMDLVDIVAINTYPGWYTADINGIPRFVADYFDIIDSRVGSDKPIIVSEIGAGAVPGVRDWNKQRWSEDYQAALVDRVAHWFLSEQSRAVGIALWQFCDVRTSQELSRALGRPRNFNNKGVLDEYRRPKLAFDALRRIAERRQGGQRC